jgi:beta-mannosidase
MQYEGLKYAVECNKRRAFQNSGTFPWQFNEPYPNTYCTSSLDYYANPKPVYYGVKNSYAGVLVSASFESASLSDKEEFECQVYASTSFLKDEVKELGEISLYCEIAGTDGSISYSDKQNINLPENSTIQLTEIKLSRDKVSTTLFLLRLKLINEEGSVIAENEYLFTTKKDLGAVYSLPEPELKVEQKEDTITLCNTGKNAVLFIHVSDDEPLPHKDFLYFDKNYFCLMPKEKRTVTITSDSGNLSGKKLRIESFLHTESVVLK